jgi:hypothetical protein
MSLLAPADFSERLVPRSSVSFAPAASDAQQFDQLAKTASCTTPQGAADAAAPVPPSRGAAAFLHFTESGRPVATAPERTAPAQGATGAGAVQLSEHAIILLRAVAAYEECSNERAIILALADYVKKIGAGPLARAVLDESERLGALGGAGDHLADDLADLPDFRRRAQGRFVGDAGTREPDRNFSRGLRR